MATTSDVLIVGGGVIGTSIAFHLAKQNVGRVMLLEKAFLGAGSSGKSGAIVRQHYSNQLTIELARHSLRTFENFPDVVGGPPVFTHTGLVVIVNEKDREGLDANLALQQRLGVDVRLISEQQLMDIDSNARLAEDELAAYESEAGYVEAVQVVASFADAAQQLGADIRLGVEVREVRVEKDKVTGVETNEGFYGCEKLVLATGPWAAQLANNLKINLPVQACRTQVALYRRPVDTNRRGAVFGDFVQGIYFKPTHGNVIHAGGIDGSETSDVVNPDQYNEVADNEWAHGIRQKLSRRYPTMHRSCGRGGYGALYGITPDWHPILDQIPGIEGIYVATGFSGHGFKMSPMVGQLVTEMIVDGSASTLDVSPLRLTRFDEDALIETPYAYGVMG